MGAYAVASSAAAVNLIRRTRDEKKLDLLTKLRPTDRQVPVVVDHRCATSAHSRKFDNPPTIADGHLLRPRPSDRAGDMSLPSGGRHLVVVDVMSPIQSGGARMGHLSDERGQNRTKLPTSKIYALKHCDVHAFSQSSSHPLRRPPSTAPLLR